MSVSGDLVTAVIPTRNRPDLVRRAVDSALGQTHAHMEVIVVVDGPDPLTLERLAAVADPRLRVVALERNGGAAAARNVGVALARGSWIAFLDDDDRWLPGKTAAQLAAVPRGVRLPIMSCRCRVRTARGDFVWPRRLAGPQEPVADYLFIRRGLFKGETFAPTSTLLVPRALLTEIPFPVSLFDDWEWLVRVGLIDGVGLTTAPGVHAVHHAETDAVTLSTCHSIDRALDWAAGVQPLMSRRAYAGLLLQAMGGEAAARTPDVRRRILRAAFAAGRPTAVGLLTFLMHSLMPVALRRRLRGALLRTGGPARRSPVVP